MSDDVLMDKGLLLSGVSDLERAIKVRCLCVSGWSV